MRSTQALVLTALFLVACGPVAQNQQKPDAKQPAQTSEVQPAPNQEQATAKLQTAVGAQSMEQKCESGSAETCLQLAERAQERERNGTAPPDALTVYDWKLKACEAGSLAGCRSVGYMHEKGNYVTADYTKAIAYYRKSCPTEDAKSDPWGCGNLGYFNEVGRATAKNEKRAVKLYKVACEGDAIIHCYNLGIAYENGIGTKVDMVKARETYEYACSKRNNGACVNLGVLLLDGVGGPPDAERAVDILVPQCETNNKPYACANLGYAYSHGLGVKTDACMARDYYRRACAVNDNPVGCGNLGAALTGTRCGKPNFDEGIPLLEKACMSDYIHGCGALGKLYEDGRGVQKDIDKALKYYRRGCGRESYACYRMGKVHMSGAGVDASREEAQKYFKKACEQGRAIACRDYSRNTPDRKEKAQYRNRACALDVDYCN